MVKHPTPEKISEMLRLCRFFDSTRGIESILERIDWLPTLPAQVYSAALNRLPESKELAVPGAAYSPRDNLEAALLSREFQENLISLLTTAFPTKRRLIFIHIPRTAGTDLEGHLEERYPSVHHRLTVPEDVTKERLFTELKLFSENVDLSNEIFVSGHIELRWYYDHKICRFGDHVFTIVRDPMDIYVSWINYVCTVILDPANSGRADRQRWMEILGTDCIPEAVDDAFRISLARRVLRTESVVGPNMMCRYLGTGTAESASDLLAICGVEITAIDQYPEWLQRKWGIKTTTQRMQSLPILRKHSLSRDEYDYLYERSREDRILYDRVMTALAAKGNLSINGLDLAL